LQPFTETLAGLVKYYLRSGPYGAGLSLFDDLRILLERCLAGDQSALRAFVGRYQNNVFGLCYRMLGRHHDAEDAAQETFIRALRSLQRVDPNRDIEPWLLAIAGNCCRTRLAQRKRRPEGSSLLMDVGDASVEEEAGRNLAEEVQHGLAGLREEHRQAFLLFHEQQLSYEEIANALNVPMGTIKTWVHRARRELIDRLQQRGVVEESRHAMRKV
jgi:RNA polymerase sigma-70 factor (ECF subfamily)